MVMVHGTGTLLKSIIRPEHFANVPGLDSCYMGGCFAEIPRSCRLLVDSVIGETKSRILNRGLQPLGRNFRRRAARTEGDVLDNTFR